jgi:outer membrane protein assembly factor BamB
MFLWDDRGIVACVDHQTGETVWVKRVGGNYFGSPVCVAGRIYCLDRDGDVVVIAAAGEYELLGRNSLGDPTSTTPAVAGGAIYFRTESRLFSLGGKTSTSN